jgi:hypothetical protein
MRRVTDSARVPKAGATLLGHRDVPDAHGKRADAAVDPLERNVSPTAARLGIVTLGEA